MAKVNYVHAALLLHSAGKPIDESHLMKVVEAAGVQADEAQVKSLVANLEGVNIDEAISQAVAAPVAAAPASEAKKEEKKEENIEKKAEEAAAGLSSLFG
ncbi:MAG: 50S ribosomal protein P1 [Candidatus Aenigmarchaeota archaeon]|nr:50S ribosomal protein P1 [Candidatus Aenigmarchaeota archaeon]